ncbi:MAG: ATP-binding cassette domain-containing protein [Blastochloris sp.]|nr:ATP-binding cassette domain-containing protein [Blastochloris sp.]
MNDITRMLILNQVEVGIPDRPMLPALLKGVSLQYPQGHLGAIIGPSGCGKSSLLKAVSGILEHQAGELFWRGRNLAEAGSDLRAHELGYVPQFSIFHEDLSVAEIISDAAALRLSTKSHADRSQRVEQVLEMAGLREIAQRRARVLSGGQRRRLALAIELVSNPDLLLCDEVTSGLDPKSEDEIVGLLHHLARQEGRCILHVTHSLRHVAYYDSVTVMYDGVVAFQGSPEELLHYFEVENRDDIFSALAHQEAEVWDARYRQGLELQGLPQEPEAGHEEKSSELASQPSALGPLAWLLTYGILVRRRWRLFLRERGQWILQFLLLLTFPGLVVLFGYKGLPEIRNMTLEIQTDVLAIVQEQLAYSLQMSQVGTLVSGLIMFEVILLALMGANNGSREAASERMIWEKEKLAGVSTLPYVASKLTFLAFLVVVQSFWMTLFVKSVCHFPGPFLMQFITLALVNGAITTSCFAISAWSRSVEQASLMSIYLVGFQLPLSGAVLALPSSLGELIRPLVAAYWGWSGMLQTMKTTRLYDVAVTLTQTPLSGQQVCLWLLGMHMVVAVLLAVFGCYRSQWNSQS